MLQHRGKRIRLDTGWALDSRLISSVVAKISEVRGFGSRLREDTYGNSSTVPLALESYRHLKFRVIGLDEGVRLPSKVLVQPRPSCLPRWMQRLQQTRHQKALTAVVSQLFLGFRV